MYQDIGDPKNIVVFLQGFLRVYRATVDLFAFHHFRYVSYLVGGLEVLVGVAGVVAVLVGCRWYSSLAICSLCRGYLPGHVEAASKVLAQVWEWVD